MRSTSPSRRRSKSASASATRSSNAPPRLLCSWPEEKDTSAKFADAAKKAHQLSELQKWLDSLKRELATKEEDFRVLETETLQKKTFLDGEIAAFKTKQHAADIKTSELDAREQCVQSDETETARLTREAVDARSEAVKLKALVEKELKDVRADKERLKAVGTSLTESKTASEAAEQVLERRQKETDRRDDDLNNREAKVCEQEIAQNSRGETQDAREKSQNAREEAQSAREEAQNADEAKEIALKEAHVFREADLAERIQKATERDGVQHACEQTQDDRAQELATLGEQLA